jgi:Holliday junction DNA helicase RuvB
VAGRLLRRVRDFAHVAGSEVITQTIADNALTRLEVDNAGLDAGSPLPAHDRRHLQRRAGGAETLAAGLSEPRDTIEEVIEPYLIQLGMVARTARGRCLNDRGWQHLGLTPPSGKGGRAACSTRAMPSNRRFLCHCGTGAG